MPNRILNSGPACYFITLSCDRRRRLLDLDQPKRIVLGVLNQELQRASAKCLGFVLMLDHVHVLVWLRNGATLIRFIHEWKRTSSKLVRDWYRAHAPEYFRSLEAEPRRFWQRKYYAFEIDNRRKVEEKLGYMHLNPVRAGLAERAVDWRWSSARWYILRQSVGVPIEWVD